MLVTHTHVVSNFANPYLVCGQCGDTISGYILDVNGNQIPCEHIGENIPCRHIAGTVSTCPSWSPVNGCNCQKHLGYIPHKLMEA